MEYIPCHSGEPNLNDSLGATYTAARPGVHVRRRQSFWRGHRGRRGVHGYDYGSTGPSDHALMHPCVWDGAEIRSTRSAPEHRLPSTPAYQPLRRPLLGNNKLLEHDAYACVCISSRKTHISNKRPCPSLSTNCRHHI